MNYKIKDIIEFSDTTLAISWEDGHESLYLYKDLRTACPCAKCTGHGEKPRFKKRIPLSPGGKPVIPEKIEYVGNYAIKFYWNDKHDTGIYTFDYLRENCTCENCTGGS